MGDLAKTETTESFLQSDKAREQIELVLPKNMDINRFIRIALTTITQNPKLMECSKESLGKALIQCAELGLEPGNILGQAYLIPYKKKAQLQIGYKGLIYLAKRSGEIQTISAHTVYANDEFSAELGTDPKITHKPTLEDRGDMICAYAIASFNGGGYSVDVMTKDDILRAKKSSKTANFGDSAWKTHEPEMWRKTAIRRLAKYLPLTDNAFLYASQLDEANDMGLIKDGPIPEELVNRIMSDEKELNA